MSIFFAGSVYSRDNTAATVTTKRLIELALPAVREDVEYIDTTFSKVVVGHRKETSLYHDLTRIQHSNNQTVGFLSGNLYSKNRTEEGFQRVQSLEPSLLKKIIETKGEFLTTSFWGSYLLLCNDFSENQVCIFPDPMGFSSLFYTKREGALYFSSDLWCIKDLLGSEATIDNKFLISQMNNLGGLLTSKRTPFVEICELTHGNGLILKKDKTEIVKIWDPCRISQKRSFSKDNILKTFFDVIQVQFKNGYNNSLYLSGGTDSSALLMALKHLNRGTNIVNAINLRDVSVSSSNESVEARAVSDSCDINLMFYDWEHPFCLEKNTDKYKRFDKPHVSLLNKNSIFEQENMVLKYGETIFWSGHGGDQLFCERSLPLSSIADCWIDKNFLEMKRKALDVCSLQRVSLFKLFQINFSALLKFYFRLPQKYEYFNFNKPEWVNSSLSDYAYEEEAFHPYFYDDLKDCSPAKAQHVVSIYEGVNQSKISEKLNRIPHIYPYYSQPLVELALTMPVYESYDAIHTRLPFREAVKEFFKNDFVFRATKGETSGVLQKGFRQNIGKVNELCLEGICAKENMLNKKILEKHLKKVQHGKIEELHSLINLLSLELWCCDWDI